METKNLDIYGDPPIPWSRALELLEAAPQPQAPPDDMAEHCPSRWAPAPGRRGRALG